MYRLWINDKHVNKEHGKDISVKSDEIKQLFANNGFI